MLEHVTRNEFDFLHNKSVLGHGVDFVGIINKHGRMVDYVCKNEINLSNEKKEMFFMEISLQMSMQKEYDMEFGPVRYVIAERDNSKVISIPISTGAIVAIMRKSAYHFAFIKKILESIRHAKSQDNDSELEGSLEHIRY